MGYIHEEISNPSFIIIQQMNVYNLQHTHYIFLFLLLHSPLLEYNVLYHTQPQYNSLIQKEGFLLGRKP
jgi:hypothetical protein